MTNEEFNEQLARLNGCFKNYYESERAKTIAAVVQDLPIEFFKKKVNKILWTDFPPKLDWFIKIKHEYFDNSNFITPDKPDPRNESKYSVEEISKIIRGIIKTI